MQNKEKKKYQKPKVTKIKLDARCAVLGFCKTDSIVGPGVMGCATGSTCKSPGS